MKRTALMLSAAAMFAATLVSAAPGYGPGYGGGPGGPGYGAGPGGPGYGAGPGCASQADCGAYGPGRAAGPPFGGMGGWGGLLTDDERIEMRNRMHSFKSIEECKAYFEELRALIEQRASAQGVTVGPGPRADRCERMAAHGMF